MMRYDTAKEAIENAPKDNDFWVDDFEGMNCNDIDDNHCSGWDTQSHRCECGNRRMTWEIFHDDDGFFVYAVAY